MSQRSDLPATRGQLLWQTLLTLLAVLLITVTYVIVQVKVDDSRNHRIKVNDRLTCQLAQVDENVRPFFVNIPDPTQRAFQLGAIDKVINDVKANDPTCLIISPSGTSVH